MQRLIRSTLAGLLLFSLLACTSQVDNIITTQTQVLQQDPNNVSALIERGNAFRDKGDFPGALADHNKAIDLAPTSARAYLARGLDYIALNQADNAVSDFTKAIGFNDQLGEAYARRGEARVLLKTDYQLALNDFDKATSLGFSDARMLRYQAQGYFRLNQRDAAVTTYLKAAAVNDGNQRSVQISTLSEAIDLGLSDTRLYLRRGTLEREDKSYQKAIEDFSYVIRLDAANTTAYQERADAYYSTGSCALAQDDMRTACRIDNRSLCAAINLGCDGASASPMPSSGFISATPTPVPTPVPTATPREDSTPIGGTIPIGGN